MHGDNKKKMMDKMQYNLKHKKEKSTLKKHNNQTNKKSLIHRFLVESSFYHTGVALWWSSSRIRIIGGDVGGKSFLNKIREWESLPSILVIRNLNCSQSLGKWINCVKGRYQHPQYVLPKVSCIVYLLDIN